MKRLKKLVGLVLALAMVMGLSVTSFAANGSSSIEITGVPSSSHTFTAYQVFDGDMDSDGKLSNVVWGDGVSNGTDAGNAAALTAAQTVSEFASCSSAQEVAETLATYADNSDVVKAFAAAMQTVVNTSSGSTAYEDDGNGTYTYTISNLDTGYYLVTDSTTGETGDAVSAYILYVVGKTEKMAFKNVVPTVEKQIVNGSSTYGTSASENDTVTFRLTSTIPSATDLSDYESYTYIFHDTLSDNLTYAGNMTVTASTKGALYENTDYTLTASASSQTVTVELKDALSLAGQTITVTYDATLDTTANAGTAETNTVYVEYSNDPNSDGTGKTTEKKVYVYTFDIIANKVISGTTTALDGAAFTLSKSTDNGSTWTTVETISTGTTFTFENLGEGLYKLEETTVPEGYNKAADIIFTITASYDVSDGQLSNLEEDTGKFTVTMSSGELETTIENKAGSVLPTTGGIGTTIFYIVGGVLVLGAAVLLITRRRMKKA